MPRIIDPDMETHAIAGSTFQFSAVKPSNLGANEYCLATIVIDGSGSTESFWSGIRSAVLESVRALRGTKSRPNPRADNTLLRVVVFDHQLHEIHGFRMLTECNDDDYQSLRCPAGTTALYDATYTSIQATLEESKVLEKNRFQSNGIRDRNHGWGGVSAQRVHRDQRDDREVGPGSPCIGGSREPRDDPRWCQRHGSDGSVSGRLPEGGRIPAVRSAERCCPGHPRQAGWIREPLDFFPEPGTWDGRPQSVAHLLIKKDR